MYDTPHTAQVKVSLSLSSPLILCLGLHMLSMVIHLACRMAVSTIMPTVDSVIHVYKDIWTP